MKSSRNGRGMTGRPRLEMVQSGHFRKSDETRQMKERKKHREVPTQATANVLSCAIEFNCQNSRSTEKPGIRLCFQGTRKSYTVIVIFHRLVRCLSFLDVRI